MNRENIHNLTCRYESALRGYLEGQGEAALLEAYETGREAVRVGTTVLEMSAIHQVALTGALLGRLDADERARLGRLAAEFSAESLVPFEITERGRREADLMLRQLNETLESKNAEIHARLEQLQQLQSLKDDLLSLIVHDLRNPLAGVLSCLDLLKDEVPTGSQEIVRLAREGGRKMTELLDDMLEVRQLEEGRLALRPEPTKLKELAHPAIATLEGAAKLEGIRIELEAATDATLPVDRRLVRRAIENLVSNALKYSPPSSAINVSVEKVDAHVVVRVADRGPGIPAAVQETLFQKFGAVQTRAAGSRRGYGLGLYIVRLVANVHGGDVSVGPREGGGTAFAIRFPAPS